MKHDLAVSARDLRPLPKLYYALAELAAMKESLAELGGDLAPCDAERLGGKLELIDAVALQMLDVAESGSAALTH